MPPLHPASASTTTDFAPSTSTTTSRSPPKRKRNSSVSIAAADLDFAPALNQNASNETASSPVNLVVHQEEKSSINGAGSPRTAVANKKKVRLEQDDVDASDGRNIATQENGNEEIWHTTPTNLQIEQLLYSNNNSPSSTLDTSNDNNTNGPQLSIPETPLQQPPPTRPIKSPPPPANTTISSLLTTNNNTTNINLSLTWQDSEITGHLGLDPDDDGTGINGIGFKPTAAQVYARAQRRKQQVLEWRAREGREARQRRAEQRKGLAVKRGVVPDLGAGGKEERKDTDDCVLGKKERVVRFAA
ncbi:hypothetical protein EJ08DRAFT_275240 [Tothia fuscella]|uniref:Uncharacterized protein n=1 Tax=Tothia fuscella TaxID=1048955 RepID=A0A9P4NQ11_9PEZI|nr:hypothetical protein EJ08DRAFT_275240 [Tothia fuscella]